MISFAYKNIDSIMKSPWEKKMCYPTSSSRPLLLRIRPMSLLVVLDSSCRLSPRVQKSLLSVEKINSRISILHVNGNPRISVVSSYIPTNCSVTQDRDDFYHALSRAISKVPPIVSRLTELILMLRSVTNAASLFIVRQTTMIHAYWTHWWTSFYNH